MAQYDEQTNMVLEWQKKKGKKDIEPIMTSLNPIIQYNVNKWSSGGTIPRSVIELKAKSLVADSLHKFDPKKASLATFVTHQMAPIARTVYSSQNLAKIPESRITMIGAYKVSKDELYSQLGREPSTLEVAEYMKIPVRTVTMLNKEMWREAAASSLHDTMHGMHGEYGSSTVLEELYMSSGPTERLVLEYLVGLHGKPKLSSMRKIEKVTGLTPYQVRIARENLKKKMEEHLPRHLSVL